MRPFCTLAPWSAVLPRWAQVAPGLEDVHESQFDDPDEEVEDDGEDEEQGDDIAAGGGR